VAQFFGFTVYKRLINTWVQL